ncbi:MAG TPA: ABC transporter substrate-binding protein [Polyangiaceae bacterium]|nr:ABC transporter substrate-binding protein [Polyangiaceae bacterium]
MPVNRKGCGSSHTTGRARVGGVAALFALIALGCESTSETSGAGAPPMQAAPSSVQHPAPQRIVSAGGQVTEVLYALGLGPALVGVDTTSTFPPEATALPKVGYLRRLSAEGVVSLAPALFIATDEAEPRAVLEQLRGAGIAVTLLDDAPGLEPAYARVLAIGDAVGRRERAEALVLEMKAAVTPVLAAVAKAAERPKVLFVYARGQGSAQVAGAETGAGLMIELAGGRNAVGSFTGFRPLTAEAVVQAEPDYYLMPALGLQSINGIDGLLALPGIAQTQAGKARRVITIDDAKLLGFGPRVGLALRELTVQLHPELRSELPQLAPGAVQASGAAEPRPATQPVSTVEAR